MEKVKLTKEGLRSDIQDLGLSRKEMAEKYGIPVSQIKIACEKAGLKSCKPSKVMFELVDDEPTTEVTTQVEEVRDGDPSQLALPLGECNNPVMDSVPTSQAEILN